MTRKGPVAIYARISLDRNDGEGVARQVDDCTALARERWPDAEITTYIDNDVSAFRAMRRPEFDRLLADLRAGAVAAVVAYHADRLYRRLADLEALIDAVQSAGAEVATTRAGDVDVSSASGRMVARILGSVSRHESERIGERVSRAKQERAAQGRPAGGGLRPFGLTAARDALVPAEAAEVTSVAANITAGGSWYGEVLRLNAAGVTTTAGNPWTVKGLRRTVCAPYMAGLRAYRGRIVADTISPAIVDRDTWDALRAVSPGRPGRRPSGDYLLSAVLSCGSCGRPMWAWPGRTTHAYRCHRTPSGLGCGGTTIVMSKADVHVTATVRGWLADPGALAAYEAWLDRHDDPAVAAELAEVERQEVQATQRWAAGTLSDAQHDAALAVLGGRRRGLEPRAVPRRRPRVPGHKLVDLFDAATVPERRELIVAYAATPVPVGPGRAAGRVLSAAERLDLRPVWDR